MLSSWPVAWTLPFRCASPRHAQHTRPAGPAEQHAKLAAEVASAPARQMLLVAGQVVVAHIPPATNRTCSPTHPPHSAHQAVHGVYLGRKRRSLDRLLASYVRPDGLAPGVGAPPELREPSPPARQLVALAAAVQGEAYSYSRCVAGRKERAMAACSNWAEGGWAAAE